MHIKVYHLFVLLTAVAGATVLTPMFCVSYRDPCYPPLDLDGLSRVSPPNWTAHYLVWSPDGSKLALSWGRTAAEMRSRGEIYILDLATSDLHLLWETEGIDLMVLDWSPDGREIAFVEFRDPESIWIVNADDNSQIRFLSKGSWAAWSPSGEEIAIYEWLYDQETKKGENLIWILDLATGNKRLAFRRPSSEGHVEGKMSWSPDGTRLSFPWNKDIYILDLRSGTFNRLTFAGRSTSPVWSPEGKMLAYIRSSSPSDIECSDTILLTCVDGSCTMELLKESGLIWDIDWSPDGRRIVFSRKDGVYMLDISTVLGEDFSMAGLVWP